MEIHKKIKEAIEADRLVIFVGSGLSLKFGLPSWNILVSDIIKELDDKKYFPLLELMEEDIMTPIEVLGKLESNHNTISHYIKKNFQLDASNIDLTLHKKLLELSGKIITTNYDNAFELASDNKIIPAIYTSEYNLSEINKNNENYIFKLHGSYTESDKCIVFQKNYLDLYSKETAAKEKLKSIFTDKVILFLGFSFSDYDINLVFKNLDEAFGNNNKHYILTTERTKFKQFNFLENIPIDDFNQIDKYIELSLKYKKDLIIPKINNSVEAIEQPTFMPRIAILIPKPIDQEFNGELDNIVDCFNLIEANIYLGALNIKTLETLVDFDLIVIGSKVFKNKLYIEDDNLKSNLLSPSDICLNIPNEEIPIVFITDEQIKQIKGVSSVNISTLKSSILKKFIFKTLREGKFDFKEKEISVYLDKILPKNALKGTPKISSLYNNNRDLLIGKKTLTSVVGRIEEQSIIATKLINIIKTNKLLNIKASGGTGKTTLIKKVGYELYNRGYFQEGVSFKSCENIKSFDDFEEILIDGFKLTNILDFKGYLIDNYSNNKLDLLVILDNFETVVNVLNDDGLGRVIDLLKFASDYSNIAVTSREKISVSEDFEDLYALTPLITDDALVLFQNDYGKIENIEEIRILRRDILEDLLNNNPLAIKLVTKSRTKLSHISELREQIKLHFFESINEDFTTVFNTSADLNIERTKSIFQSINYSYTTLSPKEKIAFELLSLFPDGISLSNFKKSFSQKKSTNQISDNELRTLRNKSLLEDYNGTLQLQPIIRRFADFQFSKRSIDVKKQYCADAYFYNCFILDLVEFIHKKKTLSEALRIFNLYKNNLLEVLNYIHFIEINGKDNTPEKKFLLNYICGLEDYIVNEKQIEEFSRKIYSMKDYFSDLPHAETTIDVITLNKNYFYREFDRSYKKLTTFLPINEMEKRIFKDEDYLENKYKDVISHIHNMEGYSLKVINTFILNDDYSNYLDNHFFYLGILDNISKKKNGFYYYEYELMFNRLNTTKLEKYIDSLYSEEHLEIMQSTYILSKVKNIDKLTIQKLVVTNPYTRGLKELMMAFVSKSNDEKGEHFNNALTNLTHIKYYYLEALYYYCLFLRENKSESLILKVNEGLKLSNNYYYQYLAFLFRSLKESSDDIYVFDYSYYPIVNLEGYVVKHNLHWEKIFKKEEED